MAINKVVYGDNTLLDLTTDTVTETDVLDGKVFHKADGSVATGSIQTFPLTTITPSYDDMGYSTQGKYFDRNLTVKGCPQVSMGKKVMTYNKKSFNAQFGVYRPVMTFGGKTVNLYVADNTRVIQLICTKDDNTESAITLVTVGNVNFSETFEIRRVMYLSSNTALIMYRYRTALTDTETSYSYTDSAWYVRAISCKYDGTLAQSSQLTISAQQLYTLNRSTYAITKESYSDITITPCLYDAKSSFLIQRVDVDKVTDKNIVYANYMYYNTATNALSLGSSTWTTLSASNVNSASRINFYGCGGFSYMNASGVPYMYVHGGRNSTAKNVAFTACGLSDFLPYSEGEEIAIDYLYYVSILGTLSNNKMVLCIEKGQKSPIGENVYQRSYYTCDYDSVNCYFYNLENLFVYSVIQSSSGNMYSGSILIDDILITEVPTRWNVRDVVRETCYIRQLTDDGYISCINRFSADSTVTVDKHKMFPASIATDRFRGVCLADSI